MGSSGIPANLLVPLEGSNQASPKAVGGIWRNPEYLRQYLRKEQMFDVSETRAQSIIAFLVYTPIKASILVLNSSRLRYFISFPHAI